MNTTNCYYLFKARLAIFNKVSSETEFIEYAMEFENENPIQAREAVFNYYDSFIHGLLLGQGLKEKEIETISDKEIRKILNPYIDPQTSTKEMIFGIEKELSDSIGNGIWIIFVKDNSKELVIHSIINDNSDMPSPPDCYDLEEEYEYYISNNYETKNYVTTVTYFDVDEYFEIEGSDDSALQTYTILKTPFDWTGYDKKNWWGEKDKDEQTEEGISREQCLKNLIENGENQQIEFKPTLLYHFDKKTYSKSVRYIIAKTISCFLNSKGGHLFIGVSDQKIIQGLQNDFSLTRPIGKDPKDYFRLEVDKIIREYFKHIATNISGDFEKIDDREIFVFTVFPSKNFPVFLKGQNGKEFYVRLTTSCEPYTDIEDIVRYCLIHFGSA
jgi:hypothetical protein